MANTGCQDYLAGLDIIEKLSLSGERLPSALNSMSCHIIFFFLHFQCKVDVITVCVVGQQGETIGFAATRVADQAAKLFKAPSLT